MTKFILFCCLTLLLTSCTTHVVKDQALESEKPLIANLKDFMQTTVTNASNTIWGVQSFESVTDWQNLNAAVEVMIDASERVLVGGVKADGAVVEITPEWSELSQQMLSASKDLKVAISTRDEDAFFDASGRMYPPCEECHIKYNSN